MGRPRSADDQRTLSESQQRELFRFEQQHPQQQQGRPFEFERPSSQRLDGPVRRFEILKSTALGLVFPQNLQLSVRDVDAGIALTGGLFDLSNSSHEPLYVTSEMKWWKQKYMLPPNFQIFPGVHHYAGQKKTGQGDGLQGSEIVGLPRSPPHKDLGKGASSSLSLTKSKDKKPYPSAEIQYKGWQSLTGMSISLTLYNITPKMHYHNDYSHSFPQIKPDSAADIRSRLNITRVGWKREYIMTSTPGSLGDYKWRSPSMLEKKYVLSASALDDTFPTGHGNLLLEDHKKMVVAVYKQRRHDDLLGSLMVSKQVPAKPGAFEEGKITVEAVVASCLAIVMYERVGWQNLLGN